MRKLACLLTALTVLACGSSETLAGDDAGHEASIQGGQYEPALYPAVGQLWGQDQGVCTGTLVADWVVLTAKHCNGAYTHFLVTDADNYGRTVSLYQFVDGPGDLKLYSLRAMPGVIPMPRASAKLNAKATMLGYGEHTEDGYTYAGYKFAAAATVVGVGGYITAAGTDGRVAPGDSGGPLVVGGRLVGVLYSAESAGSARALYTSVAAHQAWLDANIAALDHAP